MTNTPGNNGHAPNGQNGSNGEDKIVHFPSLAERRAKIMAQNKKPKQKQPPFLNLSRIPPFTRAMIATFIIVHIVLTLLPPETQAQIVYTFGFVPAYFTGALKPFPWGAGISPLTHLFLHGGWMHIAFNTVMALSLGMVFERTFGTRRMVIFFFLCGLAGALAYFITAPFSEAPVIGASGSISGLFGAVIVQMNERPGMHTRFKTPWPIIGFWLAFMVLSGMLSGDALAWQAHVGGFLAGIGLYYGMKSGKIKL